MSEPKVYLCDLEGINCNHILSPNQRFVPTLCNGENVVSAIITEDDKDNRMFGGAFVKIAVKGLDDIFVSTSMNEEQFKFFIHEQFKYPTEKLYRFY